MTGILCFPMAAMLAVVAALHLPEPLGGVGTFTRESRRGWRGSGAFRRCRSLSRCGIGRQPRRPLESWSRQPPWVRWEKKDNALGERRSLPPVLVTRPRRRKRR